jgi:hypothetical protein
VKFGSFVITESKDAPKGKGKGNPIIKREK